MDRKRLTIIGLTALTLALVVSYGAYQVLRRAFTSNGGKMATVVVAATDLAVGQRLDTVDLRTVQLPESDLPAGTVRSVADAVGRGVVVPISKNDLVLLNKLAGEGAGAGLPALIAPGMRAVSVKVNDVVAVAGFATPGTRVDVLLTGNPDRTNNPENVTTTTVLRNVQVLAAGQKLQKNAEGKPETVPVITLLVSPQDAERLTLASSQGRIQLTLRNPLDSELPATTSVRNAALYDGAVAPPRPVSKEKVSRKNAPPPLSVSAVVVEVIRGDKRESTKF